MLYTWSTIHGATPNYSCFLALLTKIYQDTKRVRFGGATDIPPSAFEEEVTTQVVLEETVTSKDDEVSEKATSNPNGSAIPPVRNILAKFIYILIFAKNVVLSDEAGSGNQNEIPIEPREVIGSYISCCSILTTLH